MTAVAMTGAKPQAIGSLALTAGGLLALASAALADHTVDGMRVSDPTAGRWGCYEVTAAGDLVLYPHPERAAWATSADAATVEDPTILGWRGFYEIRPGGSVALQPFAGLSAETAQENACAGATIH